ncbi:hypothetical protein [Chitinimonas naiadis]
MPATIYSKTDKGREEIERRLHGLPAKARRLLILVDGLRPANELAAAIGLTDELPGLLALLREGGFVTSSAMASFTAPVQPARLAPPVEPAKVPTVKSPAMLPAPISPAEPIRIDPEVLAIAKRIMLDSTEQYLGLLGAEIKQRIATTHDADTLSRCVAKWSLAMRESRLGRSQAAEYLQQVQSLLWEETPALAS